MQSGGIAARAPRSVIRMSGPAVNACVFQRVEVPPGKGRLPSSNRSGGGGNESVGAFDGKGHLVTPRRCRP